MIAALPGMKKKPVKKRKPKNDSDSESSYLEHNATSDNSDSEYFHVVHPKDTSPPIKKKKASHLTTEVIIIIITH